MVLYDSIGGDSLKAIQKNNDYVLYLEYDNTGSKYYLCIPTGNEMNYQIFFGLDKDNMDSDEIINGIVNTYSNIIEGKKNIIYINSIIGINDLIEAAKDNDQRLYNYLLDKIHQTINHAYEIIIKEKLAVIDSVITMVKKDDDDAKFIDWLETNMPMYIHSISLNIDRPYELDDMNPLPFVDTSDNGGGNLLTGGIGDSNLLTQNKGVSKKKKPKKNNHGFGNIILIIILLMIVFVVGISIAYILIK